LDRFDVIVVGCGPAGASAARAAALKGRRVMIVDRRRSVGVPSRCAGYVPDWLRPITGFDDGAVLQRADGIRLIAQDGRSREVVAPGYILDRSRFDKTLAIHALEAGADLANALVLSRNGGRVVIRRNGVEASFSAEAIIGADGPASLIGRSIRTGPGRPRVMATLQYEVGLRTQEAWAEYYHLGRNDTGWFVPCGRTAHVGVGIWKRGARRLRSRLASLMGQLAADGRIHADGILSASGGLLPILKPGPVCSRDVLLAGDAGGLSDPFSGAGIAAAVVSGDYAGCAAADAVGHPDQMLDFGTGIRGELPSYDGRSQVRPAADRFDETVDRLACVAGWQGRSAFPIVA